MCSNFKGTYRQRASFILHNLSKSLVILNHLNQYGRFILSTRVFWISIAEDEGLRLTSQTRSFRSHLFWDFVLLEYNITYCIIYKFFHIPFHFAYAFYAFFFSNFYHRPSGLHYLTYYYRCISITCFYVWHWIFDLHLCHFTSKFAR